MATAVCLSGDSCQDVRDSNNVLYTCIIYIYEPQTGIQQHNGIQKVNFIWSKNRQVKGNTQREREKAKRIAAMEWVTSVSVNTALNTVSWKTARATVSKPVSLLSG